MSRPRPPNSRLAPLLPAERAADTWVVLAAALAAVLALLMETPLP